MTQPDPLKKPTADPESQYVELERHSVHDRPLATEQTLELREEELLVHRELQDVGHVVVRTVIDEEPARLEVEACSEEVEVEHVPIGQAVTERREPWEEDDVLIVPVYEEQLVVTKRLVLREQLRIRRVGNTRRELFEDTVRRERIVVEDPENTGMVHERFPAEDAEAHQDDRGGLVEGLVRKALQ